MFAYLLCFRLTHTCFNKCVEKKYVTFVLFSWFYWAFWKVSSYLVLDNRFTLTLINKLLYTTRYKEGELNMGENSCIDRCVSKYWQVSYWKMLSYGCSVMIWIWLSHNNIVLARQVLVFLHSSFLLKFLFRPFCYHRIAGVLWSPFIVIIMSYMWLLLLSIFFGFHSTSDSFDWEFSLKRK